MLWLMPVAMVMLFAGPRVGGAHGEFFDDFGGTPWSSSRMTQRQSFALSSPKSAQCSQQIAVAHEGGAGLEVGAQGGPLAGFAGGDFHLRGRAH